MRMTPRLKFLFPLFLALGVTACSNGNVRMAQSYNAPPPPPVKHPFYDPYAAYGEANATWQPPVVDRRGTVLKPADPSTQATRPNYETAPWATGAGGSSAVAPSGTF